MSTSPPLPGALRSLRSEAGWHLFTVIFPSSSEGKAQQISEALNTYIKCRKQMTGWEMIQYFVSQVLRDSKNLCFFKVMCKSKEVLSQNIEPHLILATAPLAKHQRQASFGK